jgi:hypothetical protein
MTKQKTSKTEKPAEKAEKPAPVRNWVPGEYVGRKVFTSKGTGIVIGEDTKEKRFLVEIDSKEYDLSEKSVKWKAVDDSKRESYVIDKRVKTASGSFAMNNGDDVANALLGQTDEELASIAKENDISYDRWKHLNHGMRRMNLGNMIRTRQKKHNADPKKNKAPTFHGKNAAQAAKLRSDEADKEFKAREKKAADAKAAKAKETKPKPKAEKKEKAA